MNFEAPIHQLRDQWKAKRTLTNSNLCSIWKYQRRLISVSCQPSFQIKDKQNISTKHSVFSVLFKISHNAVKWSGTQRQWISRVTIILPNTALYHFYYIEMTASVTIIWSDRLIPYFFDTWTLSPFATNMLLHFMIETCAKISVIQCCLANSQVLIFPCQNNQIKCNIKKSTDRQNNKVFLKNILLFNWGKTNA